MPDDLILSDCSAILGGRPVLHAISLNLASPGLHCLIGSNGAGKTTLLRLICGLLDSWTGSLRLAGRDISRLAGRERAQLISYVPQIADDGIPLRLRDSLEIARLSNPLGKADVDRLLVQLRLEHLAARQLGELSGGELKRAMIAQALAQDTQVLLLDEPTAHLDPPARLEIMQLLREIAHGQERLVLCSLHYPELAREYADSVLLLRDGRIVGSGKPGEMTTEQRLDDLYAQREAAVEVLR